MAELYRVQHPSGFTMTLGALMRPHDPREDVHAFTAAVPLKAADLTQARSLARWKLANGSVVDLRPAIEDQGPLGACASYSAIALARLAARLAGVSQLPPMLTGDWLYEQARKALGTFPQDSGSTLADNDDLLLKVGGPLESQYPEHHQAAYDYGTLPASVLNPQEWISAHLPFYPAAGNVLQNIWNSLDQGMGIHLGTSWPNQWFNPTHGVETTSFTPNDYVGGHAVYIWGIAPYPSDPSGVMVLHANQWTPQWAADAPSSGLPDMRPGDFAIPGSVFLMRNTPIFELRSIAAKTAPQPGALVVHAGGPYTVVQNGNVALSGTVAGGTPPYRSQWQLAGTVIGSGNQLQFGAALLPNTYKLSFYVVDAAGVVAHEDTSLIVTATPPPPTPTDDVPVSVLMKSGKVFAVR